MIVECRIDYSTLSVNEIKRTPAVLDLNGLLRGIEKDENGNYIVVSNSTNGFRTFGVDSTDGSEL